MARWWMMSGRMGRLSLVGSLGALGVFVLGLSIGDRLQAQRVYRWTDERGVVHFSDSPPPQGTGNVEMKNLPRQPVAPPVAAEEPEDGPAAAEPKKASTTPTPKRHGEAQIEILDQNQDRTGDAVYEFSGKVQNTGGTTAENVFVSITVTEPNQGARCVSETIDVDPPTLKPGEKGEYFVSLENPCFHGPINTEIRPGWE